MEWALAVVALALIAFGVVSRRVHGTPITPAIIFVGIGLVVGSQALDLFDPSPTGEPIRVLAEATLTLVLFADASRINMRTLRREYTVPARLLGIGLPLTIAFGALLAATLFGALSVPEALVLAVLLAPTDAALGQAVVTEPRLPSRIRQGLNVESGLNDGICVPLLFIVLAVAEADAGEVGVAHAIRLVSEEIGYGLLGGVVAGAVAGAAVVLGSRWGLIGRAWLQIIPVAGAALAYGLATPLGGSGFIAAFVAGMTFGALRRRAKTAEVTLMTDELGEVLNAVTLLAFGAVLLWPALDGLTWRIALYALLSLTVVRMVPVAIAMLGAGARAPDDRVPGLVRPPGPGVDRVRPDRRPGGRPAAHEHHPPDDLRDGRPLGARPRRHGRTAGAPLRRVVLVASGRREARHGERPGGGAPLAASSTRG